MVYLRIETGELINLELISKVEMLENKREAKLWNAGVLEAQSGIAYRYFMDRAACFEETPLQSGGIVLTLVS